MPDTLPPLRYAATSVAGYWVKRIEPGLTLELSKPLKYTSAAVASSEVAPKKLSTSVVSANALTTPIGTRVFLVSTRPIRSRALPPAARTPGVTETNCLAGIVDMEPSLCCWIFLVYIDQADDHRICKLLRNLYHHIRLKHSLHDPPPFVLLLGVQKGHLSGVFSVERDHAIIWDLPDKLLNRNIVPEKSRDGLRHIPGIGVVGAVKVELDRDLRGLQHVLGAPGEYLAPDALARRDDVGPSTPATGPERSYLRAYSNPGAEDGTAHPDLTREPGEHRRNSHRIADD